ncbi:glycerophosphodiester phosphodiesterase [Cohnella suwonensis]|uniref:Glycerophosphodiester phosphodiesterase n=1 Tax=Cohnella suwonensis TaxID=696072 RepID=A0ABW0M4E1_9BACL
MDETTKEKLHPCVAHRGFSGKAPENTMAAFRMAIALPYVNWIELDVHLSKDDVPVVIHDGELKRTTNGNGRVREKTAKELGNLDAGSWFDPGFSGEKVPTLGEVLDLTAGRCRLNVELKGDDGHRALLAAKAVETIRSRGRENDTVITSFQDDILKEVRSLSRTIRTGLIVDEGSNDLIDRVKSLGADFLSIGFHHLNEELLAKATQASVDVMAWTVNSASDLSRLASRPEAFQLCTNYPDRWEAAVRGEK